MVVCLCPRCSRLGSAVIGCDVNGYMLSLGDGVKDAVALTSAAQGNSLLYLPRDDLPLAQQEANEMGGVEVWDEDNRGSAGGRGQRCRPMDHRGVKETTGRH